jgi:2-aminobenzoate-CoA ligase
MNRSGHIDTFARDNLPAPQRWPEFLFERPELQFAPRLNCAVELLDRAIARGWGERDCVLGDGVRWTYAELQAQADRIARVLVEDMGLVSGNRVLLRGANSPMLAACWFGVVKAGGIAVGTMPLLRARELTTIVHKAQVTHALCDAKLSHELQLAQADCPTLRQVLHYHDRRDTGLEARAARKPARFDAWTPRSTTCA